MDAVRALLLWLLVWLKLAPRPDFLARVVDDHPVPANMEPGILYIVGDQKFQKWAYLRCPAKLDEVIQLSLQKKRRPRWTVCVDFLRRPTVHPSIWQLEGSYAHFWIKGGTIHWAVGTGQKPALVPNVEEET